MAKLDWKYSRRGCVTCGRAEDFLARAEVQAGEVVDARKATIDGAGAIAVARKAKEIFAAKGKKVVHVRVGKDQPSDAELAKLVIGPTGNLRAPAVRIGTTLVIGFDEETYARLFGAKPPRNKK